MNHATLDNLDEIMDVFKQYGDTFPHIRKDKIETMIEFHNVIWEEKVLITYNRYKRKQAVAMMTEKDRVISAYEAQKGDCILHQIAAKNQGDGSGKRVFEKFIEYDKGRDIVLSVRSLNTRDLHPAKFGPSQIGLEEVCKNAIKPRQKHGIRLHVYVMLRLIKAFRS